MSNLAKVVWSVYFSEVKAWGEGGIIGVVSLLLDLDLSCQLKSSTSPYANVFLSQRLCFRCETHLGFYLAGAHIK